MAAAHKQFPDETKRFVKYEKGPANGFDNYDIDPNNRHYSRFKLHINLEEQSFQVNIATVNSILEKVAKQFNPHVLVGFKYRHLSIPQDYRLMARCFQLFLELQDCDLLTRLDSLISLIEYEALKNTMKEKAENMLQLSNEEQQKICNNVAQGYSLHSRQYEGQGQYTLYFPRGISAENMAHFAKLLNEKLLEEKSLISGTFATNNSSITPFLSFRQDRPTDESAYDHAEYKHAVTLEQKTELALKARALQESSDHYKTLVQAFKAPVASATPSTAPCCLLDLSAEQLKALSLFAKQGYQESQLSKTNSNVKFSNKPS